MRLCLSRDRSNPTTGGLAGIFYVPKCSRRVVWLAGLNAGKREDGGQLTMYTTAPKSTAAAATHGIAHIIEAGQTP